MSMTQSYFAISRHVDAPRERIFQAWIETAIAFTDVDAPARLVFALDEDDETALAIVTLADEGDHTVVTFEGSAPAAEADEIEHGWCAMLDALVAAVAQGSQAGGNTAAYGPGRRARSAAPGRRRGAARSAAAGRRGSSAGPGSWRPGSRRRWARRRRARPRRSSRRSGRAGRKRGQVLPHGLVA